MNQGESKRGNRLAVCDSPDRELEAGAINPVILSSAPVSNFQFQISPANDPLGRRASTTVGGVTVRHVYDGVHCAADIDAAGAVVRSYTWGPGIDNLLAVTCHSGSSATTYYALTDIQGTVHGFADADGNLVESYAYDAWGNVLAVRDASGLPIQNLKSPIGNRYLFQGREYSHATGLYNFRLRWYDPATGRWISKDPIGISGGLNLYAFCGNDPVNYVDPMGVEEKSRKEGRSHSGEKILQNIRTYYDALEIVAERTWWVNDTFLEYLTLFSLSDGPWGPLDYKCEDGYVIFFEGKFVPGDYFGNYVAGYQAGYGDSPGLITGVLLGGQLYAALPGDEPAGDEESLPAISAGYLAGSEARKIRSNRR